MKETRFKICRPVAATMMVVALAIAATAQDQVPFKGAMHGSDTDIAFTNSTVTVLTIGTGIGTHLGQFSFTQTVVVNFTDGHDAGSAVFIAANGDSIFTTLAGGGQATAPNEFDITEEHTITGGTGRFTGAHGTFKVTRHASGTTFLTSGTFDGTITPPGAVH